MIFGCCALAFGALLASLVWGGCHGGECFVSLQSLDKPILSAMTISIAVGVAAIAYGIFLRCAKPGSNVGLPKKRLP
jgi:vacuolar-type H+-ATPase subunit I/STV1